METNESRRRREDRKRITAITRTIEKACESGKPIIGSRNLAIKSRVKHYKQMQLMGAVIAKYSREHPGWVILPIPTETGEAKYIIANQSLIDEMPYVKGRFSKAISALRRAIHELDLELNGPQAVSCVRMMKIALASLRTANDLLTAAEENGEFGLKEVN